MQEGPHHLEGQRSRASKAVVPSLAFQRQIHNLLCPIVSQAQAQAHKEHIVGIEAHGVQC